MMFRHINDIQNILEVLSFGILNKKEYPLCIFQSQFVKTHFDTRI